MDPWNLYTLMVKSRRFEEVVSRLWQEGLISGEMHLGTGEEAILAGVVSQLKPGDAIAADHRGTAAFLMRGVDPVALLREMLGREDGLCRGWGGHMHLYSKAHLAASSGIVGASGPAAAGFALAAEYLRPGAIAVAFFGEGAMNQGMLMEAINLAAVWQLPILFVCKDDDWAITTKPGTTAGSDMGTRVRGLGVRYETVNGLEVGPVWEAAGEAIARARNGEGPTFLHASCVHLEGHFLGLTLIRVLRNPFRELPVIVGPLVRAFLRRRGGSLQIRWAGMKTVLNALLGTWNDPRREAGNDPVLRAQELLCADPERLEAIDQRVEAEITGVLAAALEEGAV